MSTRSIAHSATATQRKTAATLPYPVIECGSFAVFLDLLRVSSGSALSLLMPLTRHITMGAEDIWQLSVHLTSCLEMSGDRTIIAATFAAAEYVDTCGGRWRITFPQREQDVSSNRSVAISRVHDLQADLLWCLTRALEEHPQVQSVHSPARYRIPDEWVWHSASLEGSGISFQLGHWTYPQPQTVTANPYE